MSKDLLGAGILHLQWHHCHAAEVSRKIKMPDSNQDDAVSRLEALRALERVLNSRVFVNSNRLSQFLRYAVEQTVKGNAEVVKEYTVGTQAYGRKSDFDPSQDTIVRTEARRLRKKLKEYYEGEGKRDEVVIFFRSGSYVPIIRWRESVESSIPAPKLNNEYSAKELWAQGDGVWVSVVPFSAQPEDQEASSFAFGLVEEILHRLTDLQGVRVIAAPGAGSPPSGNHGGTSESGHPQVQVVISGTLRRDHDLLRAVIRLTTASGLVLWSQRYDTALERGAQLKMQEAVAAALLSRISPRETIVQRFAGTPTEALYRLYSEVLAAEALLEESTIGSITRALRMFEDLKAKAPDYTRVDCGIAQCCLGLAQRGGVPSGEYVTRALSVARSVAKRAPEQPEAHSVLGLALGQEWKWGEAEKSFRTAERLGNQHSIHRQFGLFLLMRGRLHEAWEHLQAAQEMDPFSMRQKVSMGRFFYYSRWHAEAHAYYREMPLYGELPIEPAYFFALTRIQIGELDVARAIAERYSRRVGAIPVYLAGIAELYALCQEEHQARALVKQGALLDHDAPVSNFRKARLSLALQEPARALAFLQASLLEREPELPWIAADPHFDSIRHEDAFEQIRNAVFPA